MVTKIECKPKLDVYMCKQKHFHIMDHKVANFWDGSQVHACIDVVHEQCEDLV